MNIIGQCGYVFRSFTYETEEIINEGTKKLFIRFTPLQYLEINWDEANCNLEDGKLTLQYQDEKVEITFDQQFNYAQATSNLTGNVLEIIIPSKVRVMSLPIGNKRLTISNNDMV